MPIGDKIECSSQIFLNFKLDRFSVLAAIMTIV